MKEGTASYTASFVAVFRGLSNLLPTPSQLVHDSFAFVLAGNTYKWTKMFFSSAPSFIGRFLLRRGFIHQLVRCQNCCTNKYFYIVCSSLSIK